MLPSPTQLYAAVLRAKDGECEGVGDVAPSLMEYLLPHFVVPPANERDPGQGRLIPAAEIPAVYGRRIGLTWPNRVCFLDVRALFPSLGIKEAEHWLPRVFLTAERNGTFPIPVATLADLHGHAAAGFRRVVRSTGSLALRLTLNDLSRSDLATNVQLALLSAVLKPPEVALIIDFGDATLISAEVGASAISSALTTVQALGDWARIIYEGASYPAKNPAPPGGDHLFRRVEWLSWLQASHDDRRVLSDLMFGDFAADCAEFVFAKGGGRPIPHYRYSTPEHWFVVRGAEDFTVSSAMRDVCNRIVDSDHFAGSSFSRGDRHIYETAKLDVSVGNGTTWRRNNTSHHLTRSITDVAVRLRLTMPELAREDITTQGLLFSPAT